MCFATLIHNFQKQNWFKLSGFEKGLQNCFVCLLRSNIIYKLFRFWLYIRFEITNSRTNEKVIKNLYIIFISPKHLEAENVNTLPRHYFLVSSERLSNDFYIKKHCHLPFILQTFNWK